MKTKIYIGAKVTSKNGAGTITNIITKSTGYVEVTYNNGILRKEMAFNLTGEDGELLKAKPNSPTAGMSRSEKKHARDRRELEEWDKLSNFDKLKSAILRINGSVYGDEHSLGVKLVWAMLDAIEESVGGNNTFVQDVVENIKRYYKASDKQAHWLAKYGNENGVLYDKAYRL
jgi:hypothetical protein